jgi:hypothetical protein
MCKEYIQKDETYMKALNMKQASQESRSAGEQANITGDRFSGEVARFVESCGFIAETRYQTQMRRRDGKRIDLNIYLRPCPLFPKGLGIDATDQKNAGSGADKLHGKIYHICTAWTCPGILIIEGDNRDVTPTRAWAKEMVGKRWLMPDHGDDKNLLGVFTLPEFKLWLMSCKTTGTVKPYVMEPEFGYEQATFL